MSSWQKLGMRVERFRKHWTYAKNCLTIYINKVDSATWSALGAGDNTGQNIPPVVFQEVDVKVENRG
jgi:hypothetical protein